MNELPGLHAHIESLVFDERLDDARALFAEHEARLGESPEVAALRGYFAFHDGDYALAEARLAPVATQKRPLGARASFYLAGLAHRRGDPLETKQRLAHAIRWGGRTFIAEWARAQWIDRFPFDPPPTANAPRPLLRAALVAAATSIGFCVFAVITAHALQQDFAHARAAQAARVKLERAKSEVHRGNDKTSEVYFVGGAGWSKQTVFLSEVHAARAAFERRYDADGHAVVLANDPAADDDEPALTTYNLREVLGTVARRMDRDDDVLFLYLTSHGSPSGLALSFADGSNATLEPRALRTMLDDAGIRWRVVVVQGCASGVFLDPLASENTLVATAASSDRPSYGCGDRNAMTDFGQALIVDRFPAASTFIDALEGAASDLRARDEREQRLESEPEVRVGEAIRLKLHQGTLR